jgi:hypothetical protein
LRGVLELHQEKMERLGKIGCPSASALFKVGRNPQQPAQEK